MQNLRVLHFPTDVGGHPTALSAAEREIEGVQSEVAVLQRSWLHYPVDVDLAAKPGSLWSDLTKRLAFMAKALRRYDVFHFNFGQSFAPMLGRFGFDLPLLRRLGKKVYVTFQGCDARQHSYCRQNFELSCCGEQSGPGLCTPDQDLRKQRRVAFSRRHAHRVFALNPDLMHVVEGAEFVPYAAVRPQAIESSPPKNSGKPVVLHAPTNRAVKGTEHVIAAMANLTPRFDVDFRLVENLPHAEAMELYRSADLVIDQLRVGWYGAFAVELMAMGKPVVAYLREQDLTFLPDEMAHDLPIVRATPSTVESVVAELLARPDRLRDIGARSRAYVEKWHDPAAIAKRMVEVYSEPAPRR